MSTKIAIGLIIAVVSISGGVAFFKMLRQETQPAPNLNKPTSSTETWPFYGKAHTSQPVDSTADSHIVMYTLSQVAVHNDAASCWSVVNGKVYDLTPWIQQHPGGEQNILRMCGRESSAAYNAQHGGARGPENLLASFYVGGLMAR